MYSNSDPHRKIHGIWHLDVFPVKADIGKQKTVQNSTGNALEISTLHFPMKICTFRIFVWGMHCKDFWIVAGRNFCQKYRFSLEKNVQISISDATNILFWELFCVFFLKSRVFASAIVFELYYNSWPWLLWERKTIGSHPYRFYSLYYRAGGKMQTTGWWVFLFLEWSVWGISFHIPNPRAWGLSFPTHRVSNNNFSLLLLNIFLKPQHSGR